MITKRIIPCLDVKNGRVVKGVNFKGLSDVSSPVELAKYYSDNGADELVFYDITASFEERKLFTDILREVASQIFIPLTVGGGINTVDDLKKIGAKDAWLRIQKIDESACIHRLMALEGAVCGVKKTMLSDEVKADLKSFYQQHKIK